MNTVALVVKLVAKPEQKDMVADFSPARSSSPMLSPVRLSGSLFAPTA